MWKVLRTSMQRNGHRLAGILTACWLALPLSVSPEAFALDEAPPRERFEVVVYGATPAGIAAAVSAGQSGRRVLLVEPTGRIGGLVTNGLSHTDFRTFEGLTGTFLDFTRRVERHYAERYGEDSPQVRDSFRGTQAEPHVNLLVFENMLAEQPGVSVRKRLRLLDARLLRARAELRAAAHGEQFTAACSTAAEERYASVARSG
jgi:flavin-dependent dehydrogenase